jgi:hypothetical protein
MLKEIKVFLAVAGIPFMAVLSIIAWPLFFYGKQKVEAKKRAK